MPLSVGDLLGPYKILAPIGKGGMGEVYSARDTKLDRDVAIKILPESFARDHERVARFEREARVLASLNHANIATLHGLEDSDGVPALVMELVQGPTLAERIAAGPISLEDAIPIALQITEALDYAHDRGVIHRDLKPANVKIAPEGKVKLLDFGLAKALGDERESALSHDSPTLTMGHTQAGAILGTAASRIDQRGGGGYEYSNVSNVKYRTQSLTLGSNQALTPRLTNEFRFNYSRSRANSFYTLDSFGGAVPPPGSVLYPSFASPSDSNFIFFGDLTPYGLKFITGKLGDNLQQQVNVADNASRIIGAHQLKFGLDYRRLNPESGPVRYQLQYAFLSLSNVLANTLPEAFIISRTADVQLLFSNWSLFGQDTWKATRTLTITYGLRWEYNAAPSSPNGTLPFTVTQVNNFATMTTAPPGTPLWHPQKDDFAPRLGIAWQPLPNLVFRAGAGIFYDLGYSGVANGASLFPYAQQKIILNTSFPLSAAAAAPAPFTTSPPVSALTVVDPNHVLPRSYGWNAAAERAFGRADVLTVTYLGAAGRKLMRQDIYSKPNLNFAGSFDLLSNSASSGYQALQAQYRHRLAHGLQTLVSYTWAHSIDDASSDFYYLNVPPGDSPSERGSSDYDIRHTFSGAVSYNLPAPGSGIWRSLFGNWSADSIVYARTAPPVNVVTGQNPFGGILSGASSVQRPNLVSGVPLWISDPNVAGGKKINKAALITPTGPVQGNLGRNALHGFGATQIDLTLRRQFKLRERLSLQARADFFNIFNDPNFGPPVNYMTSPLFGQATQMLGASLGSGGQNGGLNPLYQIGGPRSAQLALKLLF